MHSDSGSLKDTYYKKRNTNISTSIMLIMNIQYNYKINNYKNFIAQKSSNKEEMNVCYTLANNNLTEY